MLVIFLPYETPFISSFSSCLLRTAAIRFAFATIFISPYSANTNRKGLGHHQRLHSKQLIFIRIRWIPKCKKQREIKRQGKAPFSRVLNLLCHIHKALMKGWGCANALRNRHDHEPLNMDRFALEYVRLKFSSWSTKCFTLKCLTRKELGGFFMLLS